MGSCYLTIDDSPSIHTDEMVDFLVERSIPALLFVRGDLLEQNPEPIIRAIKHGMVIGNHSYSHIAFGDMSYDEAIKDIEKCNILIDQAYKDAGVKRQGKYFRFPYLDRGNGDRIERHFDNVSDIDINTDDDVQKLQTYLLDNGFIQPFPKCDHPIYKNKSIYHAKDCLMTFTSFDWMLTDRHKGNWDFKTINDLTKRMDNDQLLKKSNGNILIFHDQAETFNIFKTMIDHMVNTGYQFLDFQ